MTHVWLITEYDKSVRTLAGTYGSPEGSRIFLRTTFALPCNMFCILSQYYLTILFFFHSFWAICLFPLSLLPEQHHRMDQLTEFFAHQLIEVQFQMMGMRFSFACIWTKTKVLEKFKFWPDDGARWKVRGSRKNSSWGEHECLSHKCEPHGGEEKSGGHQSHKDKLSGHHAQLYQT